MDTEPSSARNAGSDITDSQSTCALFHDLDECNNGRVNDPLVHQVPSYTLKNVVSMVTDHNTEATPTKPQLPLGEY